MIWIILFILIIMYFYYCSDNVIEYHENNEHTCNSQITVLSDLNHSTREKLDRIVYEINDVINNDLDISTLNAFLRNEIIKANIGVERLNKKNIINNHGMYSDEVKELLNELDKEIEEENIKKLEDNQKEDYIQKRESIKEKEEKYLDGEKLITIPKELLFSKYQKCIDNPILKESKQNQERVKELIKEKNEIQEEINIIHQKYGDLQKEFDFLKENQEKITKVEINKLTKEYEALMNIIEGDTINNKILKIKEMNQKIKNIKNIKDDQKKDYYSPLNMKKKLSTPLNRMGMRKPMYSRKKQNRRTKRKRTRRSFRKSPRKKRTPLIKKWR